MSGRSLSLTIVALLALAAPAGAAPWSAPRAISSPPGQTASALFDPGIAFTASGRSVAAWATEAGETGDRIAAATGTAGVNVRAAERVAAGSHGDFATFGSTRVAFAGTTGGDRPAVALVGLSDLAHGRVRTLFRDRRALSALAAGNARGDLAVVTFASRRGGVALDPLAPFLFVKRAGRPFGAAIRLGAFDPRLGDFDVAIDARGDVLVAWARGGHVLARVRGHRGRLGPKKHLGRGRDPQISAAIVGGGRAAVVWQTRTEVVLARAYARNRFTEKQLLDRFPATHGCRIEVVYAGTEAIAAWSAPHGGHLVVRSGSQTVSDPTTDSCLTDLAAGPSGEAALLWAQGPERSTIAAAVRDPGGAQFSPDGSLATSGRPDAFLAFDPTSGRVAAVWVDSAKGEVMSATREPLTSR